MGGAWAEEHSQSTAGPRTEGRRLARVCEVDKLEELVTEGLMISNVDQCAIKGWEERRVSDGWH